MPMRCAVFQRVALDEFEWIVVLWTVVHADYLIESGAMIAHCSAASAAKQIEQSHFRYFLWRCL
jgi:hypothetical protein